MTMDMKVFAKMLSAYGADFSRWEGVDPADAEAFRAGSVEAQKLYAQAQMLDQALDVFAVDKADPALQAKVMSRLETGSVSKKTAGFGGAAGWAWGGAAFAVAASVALFWSAGGVSVPEKQQRLASAAPSVERFMDEMDNAAREAQAEAEILALWEMADAGRAADDQAAMEAFLDSLFSDEEGTVKAPANAPPAAAQDPEEPVDIWDFFMNNPG